MVASQIIMRALCNRAVQYRAGNHTVVRVNQFAGGNLRHLRTQNGTQEARFVDLRAAQSNYALGIQTTCYEQTSDRNHVLIIDGPNGFIRADRLDEMNVRAAQTRGMRAAEFVCFNVGGVFRRHVRTGCFTHMDFAFGQTAQHQQTSSEILGGFFDHDHRVCRQRIGVHRIDENGERLGINGGNFAEWTGTQRSPQTGLNQIAAHFFAA